MTVAAFVDPLWQVRDLVNSQESIEARDGEPGSQRRERFVALLDRQHFIDHVAKVLAHLIS
jgi:hypothetical protein